MRVSTEKDDPGFVPPDRRKMVVTLDGEVQRGVLTADDDLGFVTRVVYGDDGKPKVDRARGCIVTEEVHGVVKIV